MKRKIEFKKWSVQSCSQCGICCRLFLINLTQKEWMSGKYKTELKKIDLDELEKRMKINPDDVSPGQKNMHD